ncbi:MAG: hypothetical protein WBM53_02330 [Maribacter sp.]
MKNLFLIVFLLGSLNGFAQVELNNYKYIIVPKKFDNFKKANKYKTSTLIKYLFTQEGFNAVYDDALPEELNSNRCLGLLVFLNDESSLFTTKTSLILKDCSSQEVFKTQTGTSKIKDYNGAYNEALTEAFGSIKALEYKYVPKNGNSEPLTISFKNDVKNVEKKKMKEPKNKVDDVVVKQEATPEKQLYKSNEPVESNIKKEEPFVDKVDSIVANAPMAEVLYAQEIANGFQLVDSTPKIKIKLFKTSLADYYIAQADNKNGVVYKKEGKWHFEYYSDNNLKTKELNIKF